MLNLNVQRDERKTKEGSFKSEGSAWANGCDVTRDLEEETKRRPRELATCIGSHTLIEGATRG